MWEDVEGAATDAGTLEDPDLVGVYGMGGRYLRGVEIDGDGGKGRNAFGFLTAESDGRHYVAIAGDRDGTGTYTVSVSEDDQDRPRSDDCRAGATSTCSVAVGGTASGEVEAPGDEDWFAMDLEAGISYRVDLAGASSGAGTLPDPELLGVYGASGGFVGGFNTSNDGGEGNDGVGVVTPEENCPSLTAMQSSLDFFKP